MSGTTPSVSIVVATRNRPELLRETLLTIRKQTLADYECHIIDDGSRAEVLASYEALRRELDERFQFELPPIPDARGTGPAAARNRGIRRARGEFVAFCDDDDLWRLPDHLEVGVAMLRKHDADFYFTNMRGEDAGKVIIPDWFPDCPSLTRGPVLNDSPRVHQLGVRDMMSAVRHHYPHPNGCLVRRSLLDEVGGFWERIDYGEDLDLVLRLVDRARRILYRPDHAVAFNCTQRDSAYSRTKQVERCCQMMAMTQHVRSLCTQGAIRRTARSIEAWYLREIADAQRATGRRAPAVMAAWQGLCVYPSAGGCWFLLRTLFGARASQNGEPGASATGVRP